MGRKSYGSFLLACMFYFLIGGASDGPVFSAHGNLQQDRAEKDINEYKAYVAATREKMEQETSRLLRRIEASRKQEEGLTIKSIKKLIDAQPEEKQMKQTGHAGPQGVLEEYDRKNRIKECKAMGLAPLQIAQKMNVSISEVELVLGLDSKTVS